MQINLTLELTKKDIKRWIKAYKGIKSAKIILFKKRKNLSNEFNFEYAQTNK